MSNAHGNARYAPRLCVEDAQTALGRALQDSGGGVEGCGCNGLGTESAQQRAAPQHEPANTRARTHTRPNGMGAQPCIETMHLESPRPRCPGQLHTASRWQPSPAGVAGKLWRFQTLRSMELLPVRPLLLLALACGAAVAAVAQSSFDHQKLGSEPEPSLQDPRMQEHLHQFLNTWAGFASGGRHPPHPSIINPPLVRLSARAGEGGYIACTD